MATTQSEITGKQSTRTFFWLRISGLPYYFFANYTGTGPPFAQPVDYPAGWNKGGLIIPDSQVTQRFQDIIGGVATPERISVTLLDFDDPNHPGIGYLSRLFAPGRVLSSFGGTAARLGQLASNISSGTSTFLVRGGAWSSNSIVYVGNEGIGVSGVADNGDGTTTMTIQQRNKYPAVGIAQVATSCFPSASSHNIAGFDSTGLATEGAWVADDIINVYGRPAALYMGHIGPDGLACLESEGACILLGRVTAIDTSHDGTGFSLTLDSLTADLDKALVAPDLPTDRIVPGYYLPDGPYCTLSLRVRGKITDAGDTNVPVSDHTVSIPSGTYRNTSTLQRTIQAALNTMTTTGSTDGPAGHGLSTDVAWEAPSVITTLVDGEPKWKIYSSRPFVLLRSKRINFGFEETAAVSLADVMGFSSWKQDVNNKITGETASSIDATGVRTGYANGRETFQYSVIGTAPVANTFVPTKGGANTLVPLSTPGAAALFTPTFPVSLTNPNVVPLIRFGDGKILITGPVIGNGIAINGGVINDDGTAGYYVSGSQLATVEQVLSDGDDAAAALARMLCSTTATPPDGEFNVYPQGAGFGWNNIVAKDDFRTPVDIAQNRVFIIDRSVKFSDYFRPVAREYGLFLLWDPNAGQVRLRRIQQPTAEAASTGRFASSYIFSEGNRATVDNRTIAKQDRTSLRSSWKVSTGWDWLAAKFVGAPILVRDLTTSSFFPADVRQEDIEDKSLLTPGTDTPAAFSEFAATIAARSTLYQFPWTSWTRNANKTAWMLSPGTYHQIVDNTLANPFTGARGITASDGIYILLGGVTKNYATGVCNAELYVLGASNRRAFAPWSPCALVDRTAATNGYNTGTKVLTLASHYTRISPGYYDGRDFAAGDHVRIVSRHNDSIYQFSARDVIASVSGNGQTVTLTTGISALGSSVEYVMLLDRYHLAASTRKQGGATSVTWQGNGSTRRIDSDTATQLSKWQ